MQDSTNKARFKIGDEVFVGSWGKFYADSRSGTVTGVNAALYAGDDITYRVHLHKGEPVDMSDDEAPL